MTHSYWQDFPIHIKTAQLKNYDVAIIGGGIAGLSVAYWLLQKDPNLKIAVIEKDKIGSGASGRNAGFVTCGSIEHFIKLKDQFGVEKAVEIWKFSETNRELLRLHIIEDQEQAVDFHISGSCTVAADSQRWSYYQDIAKIMTNHGLDVQKVNAQQMGHDYGVTGFEGGIVYSQDGSVHPLKLLNKLLSKIKVHIHEHTEVKKLVKDKSQWVIETNQGKIHAAKTIVTVNAYLPLLRKEFAQLIVPGRGQILLTKPLPQFVKGPCYLTKHLCYFRQLPTGELLIGGFRNLDIENEKTHADAVTEIIQKALFDFVQNHFRLGRDCEILKQWSGIMGYSPDGQMLIGKLPSDENLYYLAGCSGHGLGLSFNAAKILTESLFGGKIPNHLNVQRFGKTLTES